MFAPLGTTKVSLSPLAMKWLDVVAVLAEVPMEYLMSAPTARMLIRRTVEVNTVFALADPAANCLAVTGCLATST